MEWPSTYTKFVITGFTNYWKKIYVSNLRENLSLTKIDKILASSDWEADFLFASVGICYRMTLDLIPPKSMGTTKGRIKRPFRFEKIWLEEKNIVEAVKYSWNVPTDAIDVAANFTKKLKRLRNALKNEKGVIWEYQTEERFY